jgi:hypothetical protein
MGASSIAVAMDGGLKWHATGMSGGHRLYMRSGVKRSMNKSIFGRQLSGQIHTTSDAMIL